MFRNYLAAALRALMRSRFYAAIGIGGLALGLCAALVAVLVLRNQYSFDRFVPGYERIYLVGTTLKTPERDAQTDPFSHNAMAALLRLNYREVGDITRLADQTVELSKG